jgi:hypothetical protein
MSAQRHNELRVESRSSWDGRLRFPEGKNPKTPKEREADRERKATLGGNKEPRAPRATGGRQPPRDTPLPPREGPVHESRHPTRNWPLRPSHTKPNAAGLLPRAHDPISPKDYGGAGERAVLVRGAALRASTATAVAPPHGVTNKDDHGLYSMRALNTVVSWIEPKEPRDLGAALGATLRATAALPVVAWLGLAVHLEHELRGGMAHTVREVSKPARYRSIRSSR